jgi:hypothetical protein
MNDEVIETPIEQPVNVELPTQNSATDTSNQDNRVSTDPNGAVYIRTLDENGIVTG